MMDSRVSGVCARVPQDGFTALHWAAIKGHKVVVEALLARGANLKAADKVCTPAGESREREPPPAAAAAERREAPLRWTRA